MSNIHIIKKGNHWETKKEGNPKPVSKHHTQGNAIKAGKKIVLQTGGGELVIHKPNQKIRDKNTYVKKDPYPPRVKNSQLLSTGLGCEIEPLYY